MLGYWGESTRALGGLTCFMEGALVPLLVRRDLLNH